MAQVFSGEGLGLRSSSIDILGGYGPKGQASFGQAKTKTYINANNGNLVLQAQDGFLADHNLAEQLLQSYNSQSSTSAWVFNVGTSLSFVSGTFNQGCFPLSSVILENKTQDERIMEIAIPRSHSDVEGSFANVYSYFALDMGYTFLQKLGVPLKLNSDFPKPSITDTNLRLYDSRYVIDKLIHGTQKNYNYQPIRMTYYANSF